MEKIVIAIDPGIKGGIAVLEGKKKPKIYRMPIKVVTKSKKNHNVYDLDEIVKIMKEYRDRQVVLVIERQNPRPGEGSVSSFTIGENFGSLRGIGTALGFEVIIISPISWKNHFDELATAKYLTLKSRKDRLKKAAKIIKDKAREKQYIKFVEKIDRLVKVEAKAASRTLCQKIYPCLKDEFDLVRDDGKSDALLIGIYAQNELVQNIKKD